MSIPFPPPGVKGSLAKSTPTQNFADTSDRSKVHHITRPSKNITSKPPINPKIYAAIASRNAASFAACEQLREGLLQDVKEVKDGNREIVKVAEECIQFNKMIAQRAREDVKHMDTLDQVHLCMAQDIDQGRLPSSEKSMEYKHILDRCKQQLKKNVEQDHILRQGARDFRREARQSEENMRRSQQ
ncbi:hypothetical protein DENSPDRAFT_843939 [Dentipellis sp. KUC8613]|nr:hypothetical protein DENSPDRAFT_843939 [Dentipellis sp. KUC8613]